MTQLSFDFPSLTWETGKGAILTVSNELNFNTGDQITLNNRTYDILEVIHVSTDIHKFLLDMTYQEYSRIS